MGLVRGNEHHGGVVADRRTATPRLTGIQQTGQEHPSSGADIIFLEQQLFPAFLLALQSDDFGDLGNGRGQGVFVDDAVMSMEKAQNLRCFLTAVVLE